MLTFTCNRLGARDALSVLTFQQSMEETYSLIAAPEVNYIEVPVVSYPAM